MRTPKNFIIGLSNFTTYGDILHAMEGKRVIHIMEWIGVLELEDIDTNHLTDAYYQMRKSVDDLENGEIKWTYATEMQGVQPDETGVLDDGLYFTTDKQYIIAVHSGSIISAVYPKDNKTIMRIGAQEFEYEDFA